MGGGAGINFRFDLENTAGIWRPKQKKLVKLKPPVIRSFDALGYMDGMNEVRGDLLKVKKIHLQIDSDDVGYFKYCRCSDGDEITVYQSQYCTQFERIVFAGYVRGNIRQVFPMWIEGTLTLDVGYGVKCDASLQI